MINYSIIIPHRGDTKLLFRLLKSIPQRSDIEVLIIDNSEIPIMLNSFIDDDLCKVTLLFSDKSKGAGHARNVGILNSSGKRIIFADSDDYFTDIAFVQADKYLDSEFDIIYFNVSAVNSDSLLPSNRAMIYQDLIRGYFLSKSDDNLKRIRLKYLVPWGKIYSSALIKDNSYFFDEVEASNDIMFSLKTGHKANSITVDFSEIYTVTQNTQSLTSNNSKQRNLSRYLVALNHNKYMRDNNLFNYEISVLIYIKRSLEFGMKEFLYYLKILKSYKEERVLFNWIKNKF